VDPNLKDAKGFNVDFGYRGKVKSFLQFDLSLFTYNIIIVLEPSFQMVRIIDSSLMLALVKVKALKVI